MSMDNRNTNNFLEEKQIRLSLIFKPIAAIFTTYILLLMLAKDKPSILLISISLGNGLIFILGNILWNRRKYLKNTTENFTETIDETDEYNNSEIQPQESIREQILKKIDQGENPSSLNLIFADLKDVQLIGINFYNMYLSGVDLNNANLTNAQLIGVDLSEASLCEAKLIDAQLVGANLNSI